MPKEGRNNFYRVYADRFYMDRANRDSYLYRVASGQVGVYGGLYSVPIITLAGGSGSYLTLPVLTTTQRNALTPSTGMLIWNSTTTQVEKYNGASWGSVGVTDHGALSGLTDDDHTQYLLGSGGGRECVIARKAADQTLTQSSTTLQNITDMVIAVTANEVWQVFFFIIVNSGQTPDFKYAFAVPSGATMVSSSSYYDLESPRVYADVTSEIIVGTSGNDEVIAQRALYVGSTTAGNIQLQGAQNAGDASDTKVLKNSFMVAHRLA